MKRLNYSITEDSAVIFIDGEVYSVPKSHKNFEFIVQTLTSPMDEEEKMESVMTMADIKKVIEEYADGRITIDGNEIFYKGESIPMDALTDRIMQLRADGKSFDHLIAFLDDLMENPYESSRDDLYRFLSKNSLPITSEGHFLAYKKVNKDLTDIYSGSHDNSPGTTHMMPRSEVDPDRNNTCSAGFHAASWDYMPQYGTMDGNKIVIVDIRPRDVVSVPVDHDDAKLRCCRYTVIGEMDNPHYRLKEGFVDMTDEEETFFEDPEEREDDYNPFEGIEEDTDYDGSWYEEEYEDEEEEDISTDWVDNNLDNDPRDISDLDTWPVVGWKNAIDKTTQYGYIIPSTTCYVDSFFGNPREAYRDFGIQEVLAEASIAPYNNSRVKKASNNDNERVFVMTEDENYVTVIRTDSIKEVVQI